MPLPPIRFDGPENAAVTFAFAHGAGIGWDSEFMDYFARGMSLRGIRVARFEFPYMQKMRAEGKRRPPDRAPVLLQTFKEVAEHFDPASTVIGGKSMGGRVASLLAREMDGTSSAAKGCVCLGYPFHPPTKPDKLRTEHLAVLDTPTLILQGTQDPFGTSAEVSHYTLSDAIRLHWLEDGDHHFTPRKRSGRTQTENWDEAIAQIAAFVVAL